MSEHDWSAGRPTETAVHRDDLIRLRGEDYLRDRRRLVEAEATLAERERENSGLLDAIERLNTTIERQGRALEECRELEMLEGCDECDKQREQAEVRLAECVEALKFYLVLRR